MSRSRTVSAEVLLAGFAGYLREQRGVSALTVDAYVADVRRFLACCGDASRLRELGAAEVSKAVPGEVAGRSPAAVRLGAARSVLEIGMKVRETAELEERLAALEEQVAAPPS